MILAKLSQWDEITGLKHISTDWQVGTDRLFNNVKAENSETMLTLYYSDIDIPEGETYFIRARRIFDDGSSGDWCDPIEVTNIEGGFANMLLGQDPTITQPYVYVNEDDVISDKDDLVIRSSKYQSNNDSHDSTHWMIYDDNDTLLWSSLYDKENKESITVTNFIAFKQKESLKFVVIHRGSTGIESKPGQTTIKLADDYGFKLKTNLYNVNVLETLTIELEITNKEYDFAINRIELVKYDTGEWISTLARSTNNPNRNTWVVPYFYLRANAKYKIKIYTNNAYNTVLDVVTYPLTVLDVKKVVVRDDEYTYNKEVISVLNTVTDENIIPKGIYSEAMFNGNILIPDTKTLKMKIFNSSIDNDEYKLTFTNKFAEGITLPHDNDYENMLIKVMNNTTIFIDMKNAAGVPTFYVYDYDLTTSTYSLRCEVSRQDEEYPLGKTFSLAQINTDSILYIPPGSNHLKEFNMSSGLTDDKRITNLSDVPLDMIKETDANGNEVEVGKFVVIRCRNNRIFIGNGSTYDAYLYNYMNNNYEQGYIFGPNSFIGYDNRTIPLINGSTLIAKFSLDNTQDDGNILYYNFESGDFETLYIPFKQVMPVSAIMLSTGEIICIYEASNNTQAYSIFR